MDATNGAFGFGVRAPPPAPPPLPADLVKLRDRYLDAFPESSVTATLLAYVPAAFRHMLALRLELRRAESLPSAYREVALAAWRSGKLSGDAVDLMVGRYACAIRAADGPATLILRRELRRYFTEAQIVELALLLSLCVAFETFEAALV